MYTNLMQLYNQPSNHVSYAYHAKLINPISQYNI